MLAQSMFRGALRLRAPRAMQLVPTSSAFFSTFDKISTTQAANSKDLIVDASTKRVLSLFNKYGSTDYIGEPMSITEHCVQVAGAAAAGKETAEAQLSCFLHDIGHLLGLESGNPVGMDGCGTADHEKVGAEFLGKLGFSDTVAFLTRHHVNAKRYLCARDPAYYNTLTEVREPHTKHSPISSLCAFNVVCFSSF